MLATLHVIQPAHLLSRKLRLALCAGILASVTPLATEAATIVWENTATTFSTGANWIGGVAPANDLTTDIGSFQAATVSFNPNLTASRSINGLEFTSGTGAWTFSGSGGTRILTLGASGIVSNDDSTQTFNQGNLGIRLGADAAFTSNSTGALLFGANLASFNLQGFTLTLNGSSTNASNSIAENISGTGGITKTGTGTWVLSGANTFTGATAINAGTLRINTDGGLGTAPGVATPNMLTFDGGTLETTAGFTLNANRGVTINAGGGTFDVNAGTTLRYDGILAGAGTLNKTDTGILRLGGATTNTHTGDINVNAGTLRIDKSVANTAIGDTANVTVATGATLRFSGGVSETIGSLAGGGTVDNTDAVAITLTTGGNNASTNFSGVIQDTGGNLTLTKTGTGTQTLSGTTANTFAGNLNINDGTVALSKTAGVNAYAGSTINIGDGSGLADSAVLRLDASDQIVDTAALVFASDGRLDLNGQAETVASIAGAGEILIGTGALVSAGNASTTFSGQLTGTTGSFTKQGTGTLTLASTINYDGVFELAAGTLQLSGITANIGTLNITGNTTIDFAGTASTLNVTNFNISVGVTLNIINWIDATDYFFAQNWTGAVADTTGTTPMNQVVFTGFTGNDTKWQGYDNQVTPVPEPATYGALLLGTLTGLFAWRRSRAGLVARPAGHAHVATGL